MKITNHSEQPVFRPRVESMGDTLPKVRWALNVALDHNEYSLPEVLPPKTSTDDGSWTTLLVVQEIDESWTITAWVRRGDAAGG